MNVVVIGVGLIGGSMAMGVRGFETKIIGIDASEKNLAKAKELGIIDESMPLDQALQVADLILLSIPVDAARELLPHILDTMREDAVVIDAGSTKAGICGKVRNHPRRKNFVASHPMAGTEYSGPEAAMRNLFNGARTIICESELSSDFALKRAQTLYQMLGMTILYMTAEDHDKHIAYVSHLTHVIAYALSITVQEIEKDEERIFDMAGSGFASTVRIAKSSSQMWTPIFRQNSAYLINSIDKYIDVLNQFKTLIAKNKTEELYSLISDANKIKEVLDRKK